MCLIVFASSCAADSERPADPERPAETQNNFSDSEAIDSEGEMGTSTTLGASVTDDSVSETDPPMSTTTPRPSTSTTSDVPGSSQTETEGVAPSTTTILPNSTVPPDFYTEEPNDSYITYEPQT
jgi:hypothetical protein